MAIRCPKNGGSLYYNYKGFDSVILLALVDAKYKFMWVDVGTNGSSSDAQIFNECYLRSGIVDGTLDVPDAEPLPGDDRDMPYFLIGDDAFSLRTWLMKPFRPEDCLMRRGSLTRDCLVQESWWRMPLASWPTDLVVFSPP